MILQVSDMRKWLVVFSALVIWLTAGSSRAADGEMELGLIYRYDMPTLDLQDLDAGNAYGILFRYWFNDTSTLDLEITDRGNSYQFDTYQGSEEMLLKRTGLTAALVYLPETDFIFRPALGVGLGFQIWSATADHVEQQNGQGFLFYGSAGFQYRVADFITLNPTVRYQYFGFNRNLVDEIYLDNNNDKRFHQKRFDQAGSIEIGINVSFLIK